MAAPRWVRIFEDWLEDDFEEDVLEHLSPHVRDYFIRKLRDSFLAGMAASEQALKIKGCIAAHGQADIHLREFIQ